MEQLKEKKVKCHKFCWCVVLLVLFERIRLSDSAPSFVGVGDYYDFSTEPPEIVESFDPTEWVSRAVLSQQVQIEALKLVTHVKLRYARTRINVHLRNSHDKELQADFKVVLPENAFFTIFQLKKGNNPRMYSAQIVDKDVARNIFHFAYRKTNGTVSAGYIELASRNKAGLPTYNLKFTVAAGENIQAFLVYERQLDRISNIYSDSVQVYPSNPLFNSSKIGLVEFSANVEEIEKIEWLRCSDEMQENYSNCTSRVRRKRKRNGKQRFLELNWRERSVPASRLERYPFQFEYQLELQNDTTSAVVISQHNGNYYFVHLFVPENLPLARKHILFLLDVSDSMHGKKLEQLQWSMIEILDDLGPLDYFNIVAFSNEITMWSKYRGDMRKCPFPFPATEDFKDSAMQFIQEKLIPQGTTNIFLGLSTAFDLVRLFSPENQDTCPEAKNIKALKTVRSQVKEKLPENVESLIFFLSDGKATSGPTDSVSLLKYFTKLNHENKEKPSVQIHTVSYGEDADVQFLRKLASLNGGVAKIILEDSAAGTELTNFYTEISSKVLTQVQTSVVATDNRTSSQIITSPVTVIKGGEILTAGELFSQNDNQTLSPAAFNWSTEGIGKNGKLAYYNSPVYDCTTLEMSIGRCVERIDFYLERLQAYQRLKKLLERDQLVEQGYICPKAYHDQFQDLKMERLMKDEEDEDTNCYNNFKQQAIELAKKHGFVTPYTSFILTTEQIDNGLKNDEQPVVRNAGDDDNSKETVYMPIEVKSEKLVVMGSVLPDPELPEVSPTELPEMMPTASKLVEDEIGEENNDSRNDNAVNGLNRVSNGNATNTTVDIKNENKVKLFTKSMRDFAVKVFKKLFHFSPASGN